MKQSLQLKLGQQLTMTPQLQQAIKLLQLSTLDLQQEIQQALESNPMLEVAEDEADPQPRESLTEANSEAASSDGPMESLENTAADTLPDGAEWEQSLPGELPVDTQWEDLLPSSSAPMSQPGEGADSDFEARNSAGDSLRDHLLWQLNLTRLSDTDRLIALAIIDATDDTGRLLLAPEELYRFLADELDDIELDELMAVLHRLQQFEPAGVCTVDLQECLLVQLNQLPPDTPWLEQAKLVISRHINQLGSGDYSQIQRRTKLGESQLKEVLGLIQTLNPQSRPGRRH